MEHTAEISDAVLTESGVACVGIRVVQKQCSQDLLGPRVRDPASGGSENTVSNNSGLMTFDLKVKDWSQKFLDL